MIVYTIREGGPVSAYGPPDPTPPDALPYADILNPQSLNKYQYAYNNPLRYIDPKGHWGSEVAYSLDSAIAVFTEHNLAATQGTSNPTLAFVNTFSTGVVADLARGAGDVLRLGEGTSNAIDGGWPTH